MNTKDRIAEFQNGRAKLVRLLFCHSVLLSFLLPEPAAAQFGFVRQKWSDSGTLVQQAGWSQQNWVNNYGATGPNTWSAISSKWRTRVPGEVTEFRVWVNTSAAGTWKIKQFRPTGSNIFDVIGDVSWTSTTGTNVIGGGGLVLQEGDTIGTYIPNSTTRQSMSNSGDSSYFWTDDPSGTGFSFTNKVEDGLNLAAWGRGPALAIAGDSMATGYPHWIPHLATTTTNGLASNSVPWKLAHELGKPGRYANYCVGGTDWVHTRTNGVPAAIADGAKALWLHCGVNDVGVDRSWAHIATNLNLIRSNWSRAYPLYVASILPSSTLSDARALTVRSFNTNYSLWCAANGAYFVDLHGVFGSNRVSTGMPDNLAPVYDIGDSTHLNTAGTRRYAEAVRRYMIHNVH